MRLMEVRQGPQGLQHVAHEELLREWALFSLK